MKKKLLDCFVLLMIAIFLIIMFNCSTAEGQVRRGRTLDSPAAVFPGATLRANKIGGYDFYLKGKKIGYSRTNIHNGATDIYHMNRLKYKGIKFSNSTVFRQTNQDGVKALARSKTQVKPRPRPSYKPTKKSGSDLQRWGQRRDAFLKEWTAKREADTSGKVKIWDHFIHKDK